MGRIGDLIITLRGKTDKFNRDMAGARGRIRGVSKSVGGLSKASAVASAAITRLAGVVGIVGLGAMAKSAIDLGSRISDLSEQLRIGGEALQTLQVASLKAGIDQSTLERAIRNVSLRTQEALDGNKRYEESIERLNLDLDTFARLDTGAKLEAIAKAYSAAGKSQTAFADVARILGERAGPQMLEILRRLSEEGLPAMIEKAKAAGLVWEDDVLESLDRAADEIEKFKRKVTIAVGNIIVDFETEQGRRRLLLSFYAVAAGFIGRIVDLFAQVGPIAANVFAEVASSFGRNLQFKVAEAGLEMLRRNPLVGLEEFSRRAREVSEMGKQLAKNGKSFADLVIEAVEKTKPTTFSESFQKPFLKELALIPPAFERVKAGAEVVKRVVEDTDDVFDGLGNTATNALDNIAKSALRGRDALSQLKNLLFDEVFALAFPKGILGALGLSGEGGLLAGIGGAIGLGKGRAMGGFVGANQPVPVNADREVFIPSMSGVVQPRSGGSGNPITFNLSFGNGVNGATRAEIFNAMPEIHQMIKAGITDEVARGTPFGRLLSGA